MRGFSFEPKKRNEQEKEVSEEEILAPKDSLEGLSANSSNLVDEDKKKENNIFKLEKRKKVENRDYDLLLSAKSLLFHFAGHKSTPEGMSSYEWGNVIAKAKEMKNYLASQKGSFSKNQYHDHAAAFQDEKAANLVSLAQESDVAEWQVKPAYYAALADEIITRAEMH